MKRILQIMSSVDQGAGVANVVMRYFREIDRKEIQFDFLVYYHTNKDFTDEIERLGGHVYVLPKPSVFSFFEYSRELKKFFMTHIGEYSAVHLHELYMNAIIFPIAKKFGINRCIAHSHTTLYSDKPLSALRNYFMFVPLKKTATHFFACGEKAGEFAYGRKNLLSGEVYIMRNSLILDQYRFDENARKQLRNQYGISSDEIVVGHIGRFAEQKNHRFLIEIFEQLYFQTEKTKLVLVGNGPLFNDIVDIIEKKNISDRVILLGQRNDVSSLLSMMDIFVLPSLFEGLPIAAVEAQTSGLPCFLSDAITKEIGLGDVSFLSLDVSPNVWAEQIALKEPASDRLSAIGLMHAAGYNIRSESLKLVAKYKEILQ